VEAVAAFTVEVGVGAEESVTMKVRVGRGETECVGVVQEVELGVPVCVTVAVPAAPCPKDDVKRGVGEREGVEESVGV